MLDIFAKSDVGLVRENNEDFYFTDSESKLIIVADGAGGHDHGEIASRLAVETCYHYLTREDYLLDTKNIKQTLASRRRRCCSMGSAANSGLSVL